MFSYKNTLRFACYKNMATCRSLVNARGASYCLEFSDAEIDTEGVIQQPQQHVLSTTFRANQHPCAARVILFRDAGFFLNKNTLRFTRYKNIYKSGIILLRQFTSKFDVNYCQCKNIFGADATFHLGIAR